MAKMVRDKKTGRKRRVNMIKSRSAKMASRKRKGKRLKATTVAKMKRSAARTRKTGRTKSGRRAIFLTR